MVSFPGVRVTKGWRELGRVKEYGPAITPAHIVFYRLPGGFNFAVAIAAIDRSALSGLEGYGSRLAAIGTSSRERLAGGRRSAVPVVAGVAAVVAAASGGAVGFPCLPAIGAALGLVGIAPLLDLLLFRYSEGKGIIAIGTGEGFVLKTHWMASSLKDLVEVI